MQISHDPGSNDPDPGPQENSMKKSCVSFETECSLLFSSYIISWQAFVFGKNNIPLSYMSYEDKTIWNMEVFFMYFVFKEIARNWDQIIVWQRFCEPSPDLGFQSVCVCVAVCPCVCVSVCLDQEDKKEKLIL